LEKVEGGIERGKRVIWIKVTRNDPLNRELNKVEYTGWGRPLGGERYNSEKKKTSKNP